MEKSDFILEKQVEAIEEYKKTIPFEEIRIVYKVMDNLVSVALPRSKDVLEFEECLKAIDVWLADN